MHDLLLFIYYLCDLKIKNNVEIDKLTWNTLITLHFHYSYSLESEGNTA